MNIAGEKVKLKDESLAIVVSKQDKSIYIMVNGIEKTYNYEIAFKKGSLTAVNPGLQKAIMEDIEESDRLKAEEEARAEEVRLQKRNTTLSNKEQSINSNKSSRRTIALDNQLYSMIQYGTRAQDIYD